MRQKGFAPIVILFVLVGIGLLAYFGVFYKSPALPTPQPTSQVTNSLAPLATTLATSNPTANWKTYTNTEEGISFKYPPDLNLLYRKPDKSLGLDGHIFICENKTSVDENYLVLCGSGMRIQTRNYSQGWGGGCGPGGNTEAIDVGGLKTEICWTNDGGGFSTENPNNKNPYLVGFIFGSNFNKIISKGILSTFKFNQ